MRMTSHSRNTFSQKTTATHPPGHVQQAPESPVPEIGLPKTYHLHTLRHFFVSTLLHEGVDKNTVADLAGHGDTSFLERTYCHPQMQLKQDAAKRMSNSLFAIPNPELLVS